MTAFVVVVAATVGIVLLAAAARALLEGWREHREWSGIREHEKVSEAIHGR